MSGVNPNNAKELLGQVVKLLPTSHQSLNIIDIPDHHNDFDNLLDIKTGEILSMFETLYETIQVSFPDDEWVRENIIKGGNINLRHNSEEIIMRCLKQMHQECSISCSSEKKLVFSLQAFCNLLQNEKENNRATEIDVMCAIMQFIETKGEETQ